MVTRSLVVVVDDDESVRESRPDLLRESAFSGGRRHRAWSSDRRNRYRADAARSLHAT
jgi:FixJ family two-component response regulator